MISNDQAIAFKRFFTFPLYMPWVVDLVISIVSLVTVLVIIIGSITNPQLADVVDILLGLVVVYYSVADSVVKINSDRKEMDVFRIKSATNFENFRNMVLAYHPELEKITHAAEEKVLKTYFDDWKKHKDVSPFEYQLMDSYLNYIIAEGLLEESEKLFLKYRIVTSDMTYYFPKLISELENGDYYTNGTVSNMFIKKVYRLTNNADISLGSDSVLETEKIQDTISYAFKKSNPVIENLLKERESREKLQFLLNKCYENAYSNIGDLDREMSNDSKRNLILLYKYDERFSIPKLHWRSEIKQHLASMFATKEELKMEFEKEKEKLDNIIMPQPFSRALSDFAYCIERIAPRDNFLFVIYPEKFDSEARGWSIEKFMSEKVIPRGTQYLDDFNKRLVKEYPFLKKFQKKTLDANYYVFHFNRQHFECYADQNSIPNGIKRFMVKSMLESENAADHLASQLVYVKQVINNITLSGLLFTESLDIQKEIQGMETGILRAARKNDLIISNIHEIASVGNQLILLVKIIYEAYYKTELKRRTGKKYDFVKGLAEKIVGNAGDLLQIFDTLKTSPAP